MLRVLVTLCYNLADNGHANRLWLCWARLGVHSAVNGKASLSGKAWQVGPHRARLRKGMYTVHEK